MSNNSQVIKQVVNEVGVTWGDAAKLVTKAKADLEVDRAADADTADAIVSKCKEYASASDYKKTPKPEVPTYDSLKEARSASMKGSMKGVGGDDDEEEGLTSSGSSRFAKFLTPNYPPPTESKLKLEAEAAVEARKSALAVNGDDNIVATVATATTAAAAAAAVAKPMPSEIPASSWERELVKQLDLTWGDAKKVLAHACDELDVPAGTFPEERKDEVFGRAADIVTGEDFEKSVKPTPVSYEELERQRLAARGFQPKESLPDDEADETAEKTVEDERKKKRNFLIVLAAIVVIVIIIVGAVVGTRNNSSSSSSSDGDSSPETSGSADGSNTTISSEAGGTTTSIDVDCVASPKTFYVEDAFIVTFAVDSSITRDELNYASALLQKTYDALLDGSLASAAEDLSLSYCDPFCRETTSITVVDEQLIEDTEGTLTETYVDAGCDGLLEMTFSVNGTYLACDGTAFPGLFDSLTDDDNTSMEEARGADRFRQLIGEDFHSLLESAEIQEDDAQSLLRGRVKSRGRLLEEMGERTCGREECPSSAATLGQTVPSPDVLKNVLQPFVAVLPPVCGIVEVTVPAAVQEE